MVTIKCLEDFEVFKEFTITPICYVYYKGSLATNVAYVGFTTQHAYKYLKRHHKMKRIEDVLNQGYSIQIYTKYDENSLIKLFKPTLNKVAGYGICGRKLGITNLRSVGIVFRKSYASKRIPKTLFHIPMKKAKIFAIPIDMVFSIIEHIKKKYINQGIVYHNESILDVKYKKITNTILMNLLRILIYCKIHCLYLAYVMIDEIYVDNMSNHIKLYPDWIDIFTNSDNYKKIHIDIVSRLKDNHWFANSFLDYKNRTFEKKPELSYYYRLALKNCLETVDDHK